MIRYLELVFFLLLELLNNQWYSMKMHQIQIKPNLFMALMKWLTFTKLLGYLRSICSTLPNKLVCKMSNYREVVNFLQKFSL